jgi:hypothetical protein
VVVVNVVDSDQHEVSAGLRSEVVALVAASARCSQADGQLLFLLLLLQIQISTRCPQADGQLIVDVDVAASTRSPQADGQLLLLLSLLLL